MGICRKLIRLVDGAVNLAVLSVLMLLLFYGCYAIWDSRQLYAAADNTRYEIYKPAGEDCLSFEELQKINPEVFGWLTVYGTNIDYPLLQGTDNEKYVNTAADGTYSLSGSLFLDYRNRNDFSDFNNIIYGHHMDKQVMFGEIADFKDEEYFNTHRYGKLYIAGEERGLDFFAFLEVDAYDALYRPAVTGKEEQAAYLEKIVQSARNLRETGEAAGLNLVLLSTCTLESTNGRHVLVGRITDKVEADPFLRHEAEEKHLTRIDGKPTVRERLQGLPLWQQIGLILTLLILIFLLVFGIICIVRKNHGQRGESI